MIFVPGGPFNDIRIVINDAVLGPVNADSTPTVQLSHNGTIDGTVTVNIANPHTGEYVFSGTVPVGYANADTIALRGTAVVGGVTFAFEKGPYICSTPLSSVNATSTNATINVGAIAGNLQAPTAAVLDEQTLYLNSYYTNTQQLKAGGVDSTGWTQFEFTVKKNQDPPEADSAAVLSIKISNPTVAGDGITVFAGAPPDGVNQHAGDGTLPIAQTTGDTIATINLTSAGSQIAPGSYFWEWTRYIGASKYVLGTGPCQFTRRLRINPVGS